ncbi:MerR family transcriptional regulator [Undibacterium oligocarboniphilum]|uniref:MerR family transcriptional regulator n=1 Tax=Undibacterium oligocarboniphilum TaxID=666702 RepID=A0A850QPN6_9BURK|nr:MerR family transcriptional regulator [Undibacterium oligocarboniphilum]MBC3870055.1 MerR family transcriptional regulator [Undibacterium oligocarboniphilum]NVO78046.1 MerR family transcriptional regulator [Undibacterium oligocarboniphilum]
MRLKIGELAKRAGLTVRTLHHYDSIGLLRPTARSESGYRLYSREDVTRLFRIQTLRRLHLPLTEIATLIDREQTGLQRLISEQLEIVDQQIKKQQLLQQRLQTLHHLLEANDQLPLDDWLLALEMYSVADRYFTPEELLWLRSGQQKQLLDQAIRPLITEVHALMERQTPPSDPAAQDLAVRWITITNDLMPNMPRYVLHLSRLHRNEPGIQALTGVNGELIDYISMASIEVRYGIYRRYLTEKELRFFKTSSFQNADAWNTLFSDIREKMLAGIPPVADEMQPLLRQWRNLFLDAWGNDMQVVQKVRDIHRQETGVLLDGGLSDSLMRYAREGLIHLEAQLRQATTKEK